MRVSLYFLVVASSCDRRREARIPNLCKSLLESSQRGTFRFKFKQHDKAHNSRKPEFKKKRRENVLIDKSEDAKKKSKLKCDNYEKHGHFACECTELKKVQIYPKPPLNLLC